MRIRHALPLALFPTPAFAHTGAPVRPDELWASWSLEPAVLLAVGALAWLYARGAAAIWRSAGVGRGLARWRFRCFAAGLGALFLALVSPLDALGGALFSAHMVQHQLLMLVAAPLLVLGAPLVALVWALPRRWRRRVGRWANSPVGRGIRALGHPAAAWVAYALALWVWHLPRLYQATLVSDAAHAAQHASFLGASLLFWSVLLAPGRTRRVGYGWGVLHVFTTGVHGSLLAALLTFSARPWYPAYAGRTEAWGLSVLEDQHLAGVIMWVPPGFVYLAATLWVLGVWIHRAPRGRRALGASVATLLVALVAAGGCDAPRDPGPVPPLVYAGDAAAGKALIRAHGCGTCHVVPGVRGARGLVGPPLTAFAYRAYIAGNVANTPENLVAWIVSPQSIEPGTAMPAVGVDAAQARDIAAYLYTLR